MAKKKNGTPLKSDAGDHEESKVEIDEELHAAMCMEMDDVQLKTTHPLLYRHLMPKFRERKLTCAAGRISISIEGKVYRVSLTMPTYKTSVVVLVEHLGAWMDELERYLAMPTKVYMPMWEKSKKSLPTIDDLIK
jgi:hypothetical protein